MPAPAFRFAPRRSWATLLVAAAALMVAAFPQLTEALLYRRDELLAGQLWRLWTGHLVHFGWRHFLADAAVLLMAGLWLEQLAPRATRLLLALAPPAISALLFFADPRLAFYGGLSGIAVGLVVLLALVQLRRDQLAPRWLWPAVLALVAGKVALEAFTNTPLVSDFAADIKVSTLAHLGGIACALCAWPFANREAEHRERSR
ncbi:MAG TPA: rhombosortase [Opitutaceae bacterium]|nr:rhombosortase [Opitutaceae bacterium]